MRFNDFDEDHSRYNFNFAIGGYGGDLAASFESNPQTRTVKLTFVVGDLGGKPEQVHSVPPSIDYDYDDGGMIEIPAKDDISYYKRTAPKVDRAQALAARSIINDTKSEVASFRERVVNIVNGDLPFEFAPVMIDQGEGLVSCEVKIRDGSPFGENVEKLFAALSAHSQCTGTYPPRSHTDALPRDEYAAIEAMKREDETEIQWAERVGGKPSEKTPQEAATEGLRKAMRRSL